MLHRVLPRRSNRMASRFGCSSANIAFSVVAIVWIASSGIALLPARPAQLADQACDAAAPTDASSGDSGLNWGSVPDGAVNPACDPLQSADEASSNWGQVPKEDSVVVVQIGGDNVVSIPEVLAESEGEMGGTGGSCSAPTTGLDASWDDVNRWDSAVDTAAQQVLQETGVQVPRNVVKSVMKIESGGNPAAGPAYGLLQVTAGAIGSYDLNRAASDPGYGIYAGVKEL